MTAEGTPLRECDKFYRASMQLLEKANVPFLVGGAYAFGVYTGIKRDTKDFDLFLQPRDSDRALEVLQAGGYQGEKPFPHWLAKAKCGEDVVDLIYRAGNGLCEVDSGWFARAGQEELLGLQVKLCAPEEIIWMKAFIMERERFDGADVIHLIESCAEKMDWRHLLERFGPDWRVLLSHLILFGYVFPTEQHRIPPWVLPDLLNKLPNESENLSSRLCRGTLLSRQQYLRDVEEREFVDARLAERSKMNADDIRRWTSAIALDGSPAQ